MSNFPIDLNQAPEWTSESGPDKDIVVSSRLRFARNVKGFPFPGQADDESKRRILDVVEEMLGDLGTERTFQFVRMSDLNDLEKDVIQERRLGSDELTGSSLGGLVFDKSESSGFLINEEDHFRIQALSSGCNLESVRERAAVLEEKLREEFGFATDEKWGYLTACPTNLGTGLRASVLLHLPGLIMQDEITQVLKAITNLGLTVRGYYGEGTESQGFYLQLSNQVTLGRSVDDLLDSLSRVTERLIKKERKARHTLFERSSVEMEDQVWRAYGTLKHARQIDASEALKSLSLCRFGRDAGLIDDLTVPELDRLTMKIQPAHLNLSVGERLSSENRDTYRARLLRKQFSGESEEGTTGTLET